MRTRPGAADERFSYHTDALGSVVAITSEAGTVVAFYRYGAFGELVSVGGSDAALAERNPLRYRAYYYDTHAALYYDPASARFLSPDPAPASAGDPRTLDRYMYCTGDPVNYYDPSGAVTDLEWGAWEYYYSKDPVTAGDRPAAQAASSAVHAAANANKAAGTSAAAAAAERARIAAEVAAAERAAALAEREWVFRDANFTWVSSRWVGVTVGYIQNTEAGAVADAHVYIGAAIGVPGPSTSAMFGPGRTDGGGRRYIELSGAAGIAGAAGFRSDNADMAPWQFGQMYQHALDNGYWQAGGGTPSRPTVSWFVVL